MANNIWDNVNAVSVVVMLHCGGINGKKKSLHVEYRHLFLEYFNLWLVESSDVEPMDTGPAV
jgi:hypothetical protein